MLATDDPSGQFLGRFYNGVLTELGQRTSPVVFYPPGTTDFTPFLTRLKGLDPDWMHNWYIAADSALIAEQALELEVARGYMVFGIDPGWWEENFPGGIDNEVPIVLACINLCRSINSSERAREYYRALNVFECGNADGCSPAPLTDVSLWQYDYVFMLVEAMKIAGTVDDNIAIANAMEGITIDAVLSPTLTMDPVWHRVAHGYDTCRVQLGSIECTNFSLEEFGPRRARCDRRGRAGQPGRQRRLGRSRQNVRIRAAGRLSARPPILSERAPWIAEPPHAMCVPEASLRVSASSAGTGRRQTPLSREG